MLLTFIMIIFQNHTLAYNYPYYNYIKLKKDNPKKHTEQNILHHRSTVIRLKCTYMPES